MMSFEITPSGNALDSLNLVADLLAQPLDRDALAWKGPISWAWHAVGFLAYLRLQPARHTFDAWIQDYLQEGSLDLDIERDARWEERNRLSFLELLDLLSEQDLPSLKPEFYQGWQDRTIRCRNLREKVNKIIGQSLAAEPREKLLLLLAVYHRLIRLPAGVNIEPSEIAKAFPALFDLVEMLIDKNLPEAGDLLEAVSRCRVALGST